MRISRFDFEGTPQELEEVPDLKRAIVQMAEGNAAAPWAPDGEEEGVAVPQPVAGELAPELQDYISGRAGSRGRTKVVKEWVGDVLAWGNTEVEIGRSRTSADGYNDYLMLYNTGPHHFGAFAYVYPGTAKVNFRLLRGEVEGKGFRHAMVRDVRPGTGYEVTVLLKSKEAAEEALQLAQVALEGVLK